MFYRISCAIFGWIAVSLMAQGGEILNELERGNVAGFQHAGPISELVCHPDGKHVLSSARDQCARLWEIETGKLVRRFSVPNCGDMWGIRLIKDGKEFLVAASSGKVYRFELATGKVLMSYAHTKTAYRIALMPDGEHFIGTDGNDQAILWNIASGAKIKTFEGHSGDIYTAIVTEGGKTLITGSDDKTMKQWDVETGKCLKTVKGKKPYGDIYTIALSPDQKRFAMVSSDDHLRVFDALSLEEVWNRKLGEEAEVVTWSPDGKMIASTSDDKNLYLLKAEDGEVIRKIKVAKGSHTPISFTVDGEVLISGGDRMLHLHRVSSGVRIIPEAGVAEKSYVYGKIQVSPGGERIYLSEEENWEVLDRLNPEKNLTFSESSDISVMALSPDGRYLALGDTSGKVVIRDVKNDLVKGEFREAKELQAMAFLPDGASLLTAGEDKVVTLWDVTTGKKLHVFKGHAKEIEAIELAADGGNFYTASRDGTVRVWAVHDRIERMKYRIPDESPQSLAIFDGGRSVVVSIDEKAVWGLLQAPLERREGMPLEEIKKLVELLSKGDFDQREAATKELAGLGESVLPILEDLEVKSPEARRRIKGLPGILMGLSSADQFAVLKEFEEDLTQFASDPKGKLWVGVHGEEGSSQLLIGDIDLEDHSLRVLETVDHGHGFKELKFSPDGQYLGTINADGTYSLFKVNRP